MAKATVVTLPNGFDPRPYQEELMRYMDEGGTRAVCVWHRRAGKDLSVLHETAKLAHYRVGTYWHFFPTLAHGKRALWDGKTKEGTRILEQAFPGFLDPQRDGSIVSRVNQTECVVEFKNGSVWRLMGSDKTENVGAGPVGVVFSEYSLSHPLVWDFVRPMLRENGGWAIFIFTPRGKNHGWEIYKIAKGMAGWYCDLKTIHDTGLLYHSSRDSEKLLTPSQLLKEEREEGMDESLIEQEYNCDFEAANVGAIFGKQLAAIRKTGAMDEFLHERDGVFTTWDLGISDSTAIWFWRLRDGGVDFIDYYEAHGWALSHYFELLEEWAKPVSAGGKGYEYVQHWLPHDARSRTLQTGVSIMNLFTDRLKAGELRGALSIVPLLSLVDGFQAVRWMLQQATRFHPRCNNHRGIDAIEQYQFDFDEERRTFSSKPLHDWTSHGADALRYAATVIRKSGAVRASKRVVEVGPVAVPASGSFSLDTLWDMKEKRGRWRRGR